MTEIVIIKILAFIIVCFNVMNLILDISMSVSSELRNHFINDMQKTDDGVENFVFNHFSDGIFRHLLLAILFGFILFAQVKKTETNEGTTKIEMSIEKKKIIMKYSKPTFDVIELESESIICSSLQEESKFRHTCNEGCRIWHTCLDRCSGMICCDKQNMY